MAFSFEHAEPATEGFASLATLKKEEAFSKVEASFHKRMAAANVKSLKLIISIPAPKKYEYTVVSTNKDLKGSDFKFVWQILKGTNSYTDGIPKWNICTLTVSDGKISSVNFQLAQPLLKKYKDAMPKKKSATETLDAIQFAMEFQEAYEGLDESLKDLDVIQDVAENVTAALNAISLHGEKAIMILNANKSIENLGIAVEKLNDVKAVESLLSDTAKAAWNKLVELIARIVGWISTICFKTYKWVTNESVRNNIFVKAASDIEAGIFSIRMQCAVVNALGIESLSVSEMFTNQKIIGYERAIAIMKSMREATQQNSNFEGKMTQMVEAFKRCIDTVELDEGTKRADELLQTINTSYEEVAQATETSHTKFTELLGNGDPQGKSFYEIGWTDAAKVNSFVNEYNQAAVAVQKKISDSEKSIKECQVLEKKLESQLTKDDALFDKKCEILRSELKLFTLMAKFWVRSLSDMTLILEKCRSALTTAMNTKSDKEDNQ